MEKIYYLDNAATTKVFDEEFDLMKQNNAELFYNPSAAYDVARMSRRAFEDSSGTVTETFMMGSRIAGLAFRQASLNAMEPAILNAISEESTSW